MKREYQRRFEVGGKRLEIVLPAGLGAIGGAGAPGGKKPTKRSATKTGAAATGDSLTSPMQGTIVKIAVDVGAIVQQGDLILVLEAMKMEQPLTAHKSGTVTELMAEVGATVAAGEVVAEVKD